MKLAKYNIHLDTFRREMTINPSVLGYVPCPATSTGLFPSFHRDVASANTNISDSMFPLIFLSSSLHPPVNEMENKKSHRKSTDTRARVDDHRIDANHDNGTYEHPHTPSRIC